MQQVVVPISDMSLRRITNPHEYPALRVGRNQSPDFREPFDHSWLKSWASHIYSPVVSMSGTIVLVTR
jgi:hypothetical protein